MARPAWMDSVTFADLVADINRIVDDRTAAKSVAESIARRWLSPAPEDESDIGNRIAYVTEAGCRHEPDDWSARVTSPGFDVTHSGMSTWTCPACSPLIQAMVTQEYGSCVVHTKDAPATQPPDPEPADGG